MLNPAYDLVNTKLHVDDSDFALDKDYLEMDLKVNNTKKADILLKVILQNLQKE